VLTWKNSAATPASAMPTLYERTPLGIALAVSQPTVPV
jgi:hypothetical protein